MATFSGFKGYTISVPVTKLCCCVEAAIGNASVSDPGWVPIQLYSLKQEERTDLAHRLQFDDSFSSCQIKAVLQGAAQGSHSVKALPDPPSLKCRFHSVHTTLNVSSMARPMPCLV